MIRPTVLPTLTYYYPLGNTPAVSLTQDLPPEQDADILLLGCGDARNILFTCFIDSTRKIDVTCCDIIPGIHARNVLLYSLLLEDKENHNIDRIWNIYYHWKLDEDSFDLLETQIKKLLEVSKSIDQWHNSEYGSNIRFCNERSLSSVRSYWMGFSMQNLSDSEKKLRQIKLQATINKAKAVQGVMSGNKNRVLDLTGTRSACPAASDAIGDVSKVSEQWWAHGTVSFQSSSTLTCLNPAFLYTPHERLVLHYNLSPLHGFPLCTAYAPIIQGSIFCLENKNASSTDHLIDSIKRHFSLWASAFRKAVKINNSIIRIFCGDALAFCSTLRYCQLTMPTCSRSMNLSCSNLISSSPELHHSEYHNNKNAAPLSFDVIDSSNLCDHLGPLNVISLGSTLLRYHDSSCFYTEMLVQQDESLKDRISDFFGVDVSTMALLLGLAPPHFFTNAIDTLDEDPVLHKLVKQMGCGKGETSQVRSRLCWKRSRTYQESSNCVPVYIDAKPLAQFLIKIHNTMFKFDNAVSGLAFLKSADSSTLHRELSKQANPSYNRASFASLLNILKTTVRSDWDQCVTNLYQSIFSASPFGNLTFNSAQELYLNMHLFGIDNGEFRKPIPAALSCATLAPILSAFKGDLPDKLCVTMQIFREQLKIFTKKEPNEIGTPAIVCIFENGDPGPVTWSNNFSSVQIAFGTWHEQKDKGKDSHPYIKEDSSELSGTSDMFMSVMVPTWMLMKSEKSVPWVKCGVMKTMLNVAIFSGDLGLDLCFACSKMTSKNVFITRFMPGMSTPPTLALTRTPQDMSAAATVHLTQDGSRIDKLIHRVTFESKSDKVNLAAKSSRVEIKFESPLVAVISIGNSSHKLKFSVPVSPSKCKVKVARKSSYIEFETPLFDPLKEDSSSFLFPISLMVTPCGIIIPTLYTSTRIDLDSMPPIDLKSTSAISWLRCHVSLMFSLREGRIRNSTVRNDIRTDLKDGLFSLFMHFTGVQGERGNQFVLKIMPDALQTLIYPFCLRLDLVNHTVVLDTAIIPITKALLTDPRAKHFFLNSNNQLCVIKVSEAENRAWKAMMPALVERCRTSTTWKHTPTCEYILTGEVPLLKALGEEFVSPICSCGVGKLPRDYLEDYKRKDSNFSYILDQYATRAAIAPVFAVPYLEDCCAKQLIDQVGNFLVDKLKNSSIGQKLKNSSIGQRPDNGAKCATCGNGQRKIVQEGKQGLLHCSRCKNVSYCSIECQKADWKKHKLFCSAA